MEDTCQPKIALICLLNLSQNFNAPRLNWVIQLQKLLSKINEEHMLYSLCAHHWRCNKVRILEKFRYHLKLQDLHKYANSSICQTSIPRTIHDGTPNYFLSNEFHMLITKSQLRTANRHPCYISTKQCTIKLRPAEQCRFCHNLDWLKIQAVVLFPSLNHLPPPPGTIFIDTGVLSSNNCCNCYFYTLCFNFIDNFCIIFVKFYGFPGEFVVTIKWS